MAKKLIVEAENLARGCGEFKVMKTDATGKFSQRITISAGFILALDMKYETYLDTDGNQVFPTDPPHDRLQILYKFVFDKMV